MHQHSTGLARLGKVNASEGMLMADPYVAWLGPASHGSAWAGTSHRGGGEHQFRVQRVRSSAQRKCTISATARQGSALRGHSKDGSCYIVLSFGGMDVYDAWRAVGLGKQARGGGVKEACKEAQFDWGRPARHGIIEMSRSGAFDVVQVATHVCSQGGVGHVRIMGGGILCFKALPDLPQQGKRETKLFKQQIVLRSRVKVNVDVTESFYQAMLQSVRWTNGDYIGLHRESTHCGIFRRVTPTPKVLKTTRLATGLKCRRRGDDDD